MTRRRRKLFGPFSRASALAGLAIAGVLGPLMGGVGLLIASCTMVFMVTTSVCIDILKEEGVFNDNETRD